MKKEYPILKDLSYYLDDELYQLEVLSKGCLLNVNVEFSNNQEYLLSFYNLDRFYQDIKDELEEDDFIYEENIVFLREVSLNNILSIIKYFEEKKYYNRFIS